MGFHGVEADHHANELGAMDLWTILHGVENLNVLGKFLLGHVDELVSGEFETRLTYS